MKTIQDIFAEGRDYEGMMSDLKSYSKTCASWEELEKYFDGKKHPIIADPTLRPKDKTKNGRKEVAAKLVYPAEKLIARRMTQMAFSIPVRRVYNYGDDANLKEFADAVESVYKSIRINGVNKKRMFAYFGSCEIATFWYASVRDEVHNTYGFDTNVKFRCRTFSPMSTKFSGLTQANIWPLFDGEDNLIALSVEYSAQESGKEVNHFDCFTADTAYYFTHGDGGWQLEPVPNPIGKIPAIYWQRSAPVYDGIDTLRNDIEFTLSRNSDNIRKNSSPILKVSGTIIGDKPVGDTAREVYQLEEGGDISTISPALATNDAKAQIELDKRLIEEISQLPDLSLENVRGLGAVSGEARRTIMADAHLKVDDESHDIIWGLDREFSVIKALLCIARPDWKKYENVLTCTQEITPYIMEDSTADIQKYVMAAGKSIMSRQTAVEKLGLVDNAEEEMARINSEEQAANTMAQMADLFSGAE